MQKRIAGANPRHNCCDLTGEEVYYSPLNLNQNENNIQQNFFNPCRINVYQQFYSG